MGSFLSKPDCPGGGDESPLCNNDQCSMDNGGCSHICHRSPFGVLCLCEPGFHVQNTTNYKKCEGTICLNFMLISSQFLL